MYYSYVMGIGDEIHNLKKDGFRIKADGGNYTVTFPREKAAVWEEFITTHLEPGYWNEYLSEDRVVFLFHLDEGIRRYEVRDFENAEVLALCEKLCACEFGSLKAMLEGNWFYKQVLK